MFMLGLGPIIIVVHNRTGNTFSAREIASDYWCRPKIDHLLYIAIYRIYRGKFSRDLNFAVLVDHP